MSKMNKMNKKNFLYYINFSTRRFYDFVFNFVNYRYYYYKNIIIIILMILFAQFDL